MAFTGRAQSVAFSYLIPKNGYLSAPVSPFSVRGLSLGKKTGLETGFSLYNVPGLAMSDLPFELEKPAVGPHFAVFLPVQAFFKIKANKTIIKPLAGGFVWRNLKPRLHQSNLEAGLRQMEDWDVLTADINLKDRIGYGWIAGLEVEFPLRRDLSLILGANYLKGASQATLEGSYAGGNEGGTIARKSWEASPSVVLEGLEINVGVSF